MKKSGRSPGPATKNIFYRLSIHARLMLCLCLLVFAPVIVLARMVIDSAETSLRQSFEGQMAYSLAGVQRALEREVEGAWRYLERMGRDPALLSLLEPLEPGEDPQQRLARLDALARFYDYQAGPDLLLHIDILPMGFPLQEDSQQMGRGRWRSEAALEPFFRGETLPYALLPYHRANLSRNKRDEFLTVLYRVEDAQGHAIGALGARLNHHYLGELLLDSAPTSGAILWIMEPSGRLILRSDPGIVGYVSSLWHSLQDAAPSWEGQFRGAPSCFFSYPLMDEGWTLLYIIPKSEIPYLDDARSNILPIMYTFFAAAFVLLFFLVRSNIRRPIGELRISMSDVERGILNTHVIYNRRDEFTGLVEQYTGMMEHIRQMIDQLLQIEKRRLQAEILGRESEIRMLQAQITPHFLYNTLDSINWLALKHKVPQISRLILALANFFRYSLNKGQNAIALREELKQVESYLLIQQARMGEDRLRYTIQAQEELLDCLIIKLVLQPFVENAVIHGFTSPCGSHLIQIYCRLAPEGQVMEIDISDNGVGVDLAHMERILRGQDPESRQHYGVRNVDQRLQQVYGQYYRVRYRKNDQGGTTVMLRIPVHYTMEELS